MSSQHSTLSVVEPPGSPRSKSKANLLDLPTEILLLIASYLQPTDLIPLIGTCKQYHKFYTSLVWEHVGFTPPGYRHPGRQFNFAGSHAASHISPQVEKYFSCLEPQPLDLFSYLLLLGNISRASLEAVKTVTVCAGYDFGGLMARARPAEMQLNGLLKNSSANYYNIQAGQDLAIAQIYHQWPTADPELMSHYSTKFNTIEQWPVMLEKAQDSLLNSKSFQSSAFPRGEIKVGKKSLESDFLELGPLTGPKPGETAADMACDLTSGLLHFSHFLKSTLLAPNLLPNLSLLSINIDTSISSPSDCANEELVAQHAVPLIRCITKALPGLPNLKVALNCNIPHYEDLFPEISEELVSRISILRLVCHETFQDFINLGDLLSTIEKCAVLENLEIITQKKELRLHSPEAQDVLACLSPVLALPSLTSFHLSSSILMPDFLAMLPEVTVENLSLKFMRLQVLSLVRELLAQNLSGTRTLRVCSEIRKCSIGTISHVGCSNLMKLYVRNVKFNVATMNKILAVNPALTRIQTF